MGPEHTYTHHERSGAYLEDGPPAGTLEQRGVEAGEIDERVGGQEHLRAEVGDRVQLAWRRQRGGKAVCSVSQDTGRTTTEVACENIQRGLKRMHELQSGSIPYNIILFLESTKNPPLSYEVHCFPRPTT